MGRKIMNYRMRNARHRVTRERIGTAEIVNVNGTPHANNGFVWVRFVGGDVSEGFEITSAPVKIRLRPGVGVVVRTGRLVEVAYGYAGKREIVGNNFDDLLNAGIPVSSLNVGDERQAQGLIENLNNLRSFPLNPADENIQVVPSIYRKSNGDYEIAPQTLSVDLLTSYTPADEDNQVVVCVWLNTDTNTYTTTASSELSQDTNLKENPSTVITYINEAMESAPNNHIGVQAFVVKGDDTTITQSNFLHDLRGILTGRSRSSNAAGTITTKTSDYTIAGDDATILVDASSNAVTITLPDATNYTGFRYDIKAIDLSNTVTLTTTSSQTIDGSSTDITFTAQYESITLQSDGSNWWIL